MILGRQPLVWIGIIVSLILAVVSNLNGQGVIGDVLAGQVTDVTKSAGQILTTLAPLITALLARPLVTPTAAPALPVGTSVEVITPAGQPNTTTVL